MYFWKTGEVARQHLCKLEGGSHCWSQALWLRAGRVPAQSRPLAPQAPLAEAQSRPRAGGVNLVFCSVHMAHSL